MKGKAYVIYLACLFAALMFISNGNVYAQCPDSISESAAATPASCQSNGVITVNGTTSTAIQYQVLTGPAGATYPFSPQSSNVFASLLPGTYSVAIYCNLLADTLKNVVVPSTYKPLQDTLIPSNVCSSNTPGGTINTIVSSGTGPYLYSYFTGSPNAVDNTLTYTSSSTFADPAFGTTYNVRVKDACGVFTTKQIALARTYPASLCISSATTSFGSLTCAQLTDSIDLNFVLSNNTVLKTLPAAGITLQLYQNNGTCASPSQGALIKTQHYAPTDTSLIIIPRQNVLITLITPCGDMCTYCYTYSAPSSTLAITAANITQSGCATASNPKGTLGIIVNVNSNFVYPITYSVKNSAGAVVATTTISSGATSYTFNNNLPYDNYTVTATDGCGNTSTVTVKPPATSGSGAALTDSVVTVINSCTSINGRVSLSVFVNGYMPNLANATVTIINPSPTNVGVPGIASSGNRWDWTNVLPGATYYIRVNNNCGIIDTLKINTPAGSGQNQQILDTVTQLCGGTGSINVTISRLGNNNLSFKLYNSAGTVVGSGISSGTFPNLPADTYSVTATVSAGCTYSFSKTGIVILPAGAGPSIVKQLGIICENPNGTTSPTGEAFVEFIGAQPLSVDYKLTSQSNASYINISTNSSGTETITGLTPYQSYTVRVTDKCGNSTITEITIGQLVPLLTESNSEPCVGQPYTLGVPDMINATYQWTKNGTVISNSREINFPSYTSDADGTYTCTTVIGGGCVVRVTNITLASTNCGQPITVNVSGNVFNDNNGLTDSTVNGTGIGSANGVQLYANLLDANGNVLATVPVNSDGTYNFTNVGQGNDVIQLSINKGTVGSAAPATQLPPNWMNTGENIGTNPGNDGNPNGLLPVSVGAADVTNADFGIKFTNPLPVILSSFTATAKANNSLLAWTTSSEINTSLFAIEHSIDANNWQQIGTVNAKGMSNSSVNYSFTDARPSSGVNYYRLNIIDNNGSVSYSNVRNVNFNAGAEQGFTLIPNPATDHVTILLNHVLNSNANVVVINAQGQKVLLDIISNNEQQHNLKTSNLAAGVYKVVMINSDNTTYIQQLVIQK